jgi:hypothetical protein
MKEGLRKVVNQPFLKNSPKTHKGHDSRGLWQESSGLVQDCREMLTGAERGRWAAVVPEAP